MASAYERLEDRRSPRAAATEWTLTKSFPAIPASVPLARRQVVDRVHSMAADDLLVEQVALAVSEACTNVVMYAYPDDAPGELFLDASARDGVVAVSISDRGRGLEAYSEGRGLGAGLRLIARLADVLEIRTDPSAGTTLTMRFSVARR